MFLGGYHYNYCSIFFYKTAFLPSKVSEIRSLNFNINLQIWNIFLVKVARYDICVIYLIFFLKHNGQTGIYTHTQPHALHEYDFCHQLVVLVEIHMLILVITGISVFTLCVFVYKEYNISILFFNNSRLSSQHLLKLWNEPLLARLPRLGCQW